jgi:hypothetical protein
VRALEVVVVDADTLDAPDPLGARGGIPVFQRLENGFRLLAASWRVLRADRELLLLPLLSALASVALVVVTAAWLFADEWRLIRDGLDPGPPGAFEYVVLALLTYAVTYVTIFFNVALICAADERMGGGDPTVGSALADARTHARAIAPWALVSVVVSAVLRAIEERAGLIGRFAAGLLGLAWTLVTYLVLPVLVLEGVGVRDAIARSKELFVATWGETVSGELGMSLVGFLAVLAALPFLLFVGGGGQPELIVAAVVLGVAWVVIVSTVLSALNAVFRVALYRYAADGRPPDAFSDVDLGGVFPEKGSGRLSPG